MRFTSGFLLTLVASSYALTINADTKDNIPENSLERRSSDAIHIIQARDEPVQPDNPTTDANDLSISETNISSDATNFNRSPLRPRWLVMTFHRTLGEFVRGTTIIIDMSYRAYKRPDNRISVSAELPHLEGLSAAVKYGWDYLGIEHTFQTSVDVHAAGHWAITTAQHTVKFFLQWAEDFSNTGGALDTHFKMISTCTFSNNAQAAEVAIKSAEFFKWKWTETDPHQ